MARRRERRGEPSQDRRKERVGSATREEKHSDAEASERKLIGIFVAFFIVIPAVSILVYVYKYGSATKHSEPVVTERGIIKTDISFQEILIENQKVTGNESQRNYDYPVLAYITPWNSKGYEMAKRFNSKFTHLSPVWYDLKSHGSSLILEGRHNADKGWISDLRMRGDALILPRIVLEAFPTEVLKKKKLRDKAIDLIVTECKELEYDGIVLESWSRWAAYGILNDSQLRNMALKFIKQLEHALHSMKSTRNPEQQLQLVYVIGPPHSDALQQHDFGPEDLRSLSDAVDGFSLMTYDFSGPNNPGPNAPLKWIRVTLELLLGSMGNSAQRLAPKIFLGINFYGNDFVLSEGSGGGAITGNDYLTLLEKHRPLIQWEKNSGEHFFVYPDDNNVRHAVFYPSLMSIYMRLEEARVQGTGISIWEIGQARFDGNSELVAELVTANGFKAAYAVKDGTEGPRGWMNSGLPWIEPKKGLDLSNLTETLSGAFGEGSDGLSVTLGIAAATGLGLLAFSEIETVLQLLGSAAVIQLLSKKLLFAEDRKQTLQQIDEFLSTKVAPKELVDDVKQIGVALIPTTTTSEALPAPTEANPESKLEVAAETPPQVNAVPKSESKADGSSVTSRPLSPYPSYPDLKPPTSPTPSPP